MEQLAECLAQNGEEVDTPANLWMNDLVTAYVSTSPTSPQRLTSCLNAEVWREQYFRVDHQGPEM